MMSKYTSATESDAVTATTTTTTTTATTTTMLPLSPDMPPSNKSVSASAATIADAANDSKEPLTITGTSIKLQDKFDANESYAQRLSGRQSVERPMNLECMLLQDATVDELPPHLQHFLTSVVDANQCTQAELLLLLVYFVALETGFCPRDCNCSSLLALAPTSSFHARNVLRLSRLPSNHTHDADHTYFRLPLRLLLDVAAVPEAADKEATSTTPKTLDTLLTGIASGDFLIVTLSPDASVHEVRGYSVCLSIPRYVLPRGSQRKPVQSRFRKLPELSLLARDQLFVPMRNQLLAALDFVIYPSLLGLPTELYDEIFLHLNRNQRNVVANVNRLLRDCVRMSRVPETKTTTKRLKIQRKDILSEFLLD